MNKIITNLKRLLTPTSKLPRIEKAKRFSQILYYAAMINLIVFELGFTVIYIYQAQWFSAGITSICFIAICVLTYQSYVRTPLIEKFLEENGKYKLLADIAIMDNDVNIEPKELSLKAKVIFLEERLKFDNSKEVECIRSLIEFYDKHKEKSSSLT